MQKPIHSNYLMKWMLYSLRNNIRNAWQSYFQAWLKRRIPPAHDIELNLHTIFILPSMQGLGFCCVLILMFIGAVNYEASLAFSLVFLLSAMFILTIFYTYRNLSGLHISATSGKAVFAGEKAEVTIILNRHGKRVYESLLLSFPNSRQIRANLIEQTEVRNTLYIPATKRGWLRPGRLAIETFFPFGICRSWSFVDLKINCLVYPKPVACDLEWLTALQQNTGNINIIRGNDDFDSLQEYRPGDSLKHVAWKQFARGQGMYTKQYASNSDDEIWLNWNMFPDMDTEQRLSRLCYCVLKLDANGLDYGLNLPGIKIEPRKGSKHYNKIMEVLALYRLKSIDGIQE